jgi:hypothetical protein
VLLIFAGSLLLQIAWIAAVPPYRGMDEFDHVYRAESVATGHWLPTAQREGYHGRGDLVRARAATVHAAYPVCHSYRYIPESDCRSARTFSDGTVLVASGAARYNPAYYAVVGIATHWLDPVPGLYVMRLLDAIICSLLIALAVWASALWARNWWPALGVVMTCTPIAMYSGSTPAPNGPEMFAGVALWTLLLGLRVLAPDDPRVRPLLLASIVPALVLSTVRTLGPLWLALLILSILAVIGPGRLTSLLRARALLLAAVSAPVVVATLGSVWWTRTEGANSLAREPDLHNPDALASSLTLVPLWVLQSIGAFPDKIDPAPSLVYGAGLLLFLALTAWAFVRAGRLRRLSLLGVAVVAAGIPFLITLQTYSQLGPVWQGRYAWPYACGVVLLAAAILDETDAPLPSYLVLPGLAVLVMLHLPGPLSVLKHERKTSPLAHSDIWISHSPVLVGALVLAGLGAWAWGLGSARLAWLPAPASVRDDHVVPTTRVVSAEPEPTGVLGVMATHEGSVT